MVFDPKYNDWNSDDDILDPNTKITICPLVPFGEHVLLYRCKGCVHFKGVETLFHSPPQFCGHKKATKRYKLWKKIQEEQQKKNKKINVDDMELIS